MLYYSDEVKSPLRITDDIKQFITYIASEKAYIIGLVVNIIYIAFTIPTFLILFYTGTIDDTIFGKDFRVFYTSLEILHSNPLELYTSPLYELPFRYLPMFSYTYIWMLAFPFPVAYIIQTMLMYLVHHASLFLLYELCYRFYKLNVNQRMFKYGFFFAIMAPLQVPNYMLGQVANILIFLLLLSLFFFENSRLKVFSAWRNNFFGGIMLGLAFVIKPIAILVFPFIFSITLFGKRNKIHVSLMQIAYRFAGFLLAICPNILLFMVYPSLLGDFIDTNLLGKLEDYPSTSLTRVFFAIFDFAGIPYSKLLVIATITGLLYLPIIIRYLRTDKETMDLTFYYGYAMLILLLSYPDSFFLYVLIWYMMQFPAIIEIIEKVQDPKEWKKIRLMTIIIEYGMIYFSIGVVVYYFLGKVDFVSPVLYGIYAVLFYIMHKKCMYAK